MIPNKKYSLLWSTSERAIFHLDDAILNDLNVNGIISLLTENTNKDTLHLLNNVPCSLEDIRYRQEILKEFIENPQVFELVLKSVEKCHQLKDRPKYAYQSESTLYNLLNRIDQVSEVMQLVEGLYNTLNSLQLKSTGLNHLKAFLHEIICHEIYESFHKDVMEIKKMPKGINSIKLGVNLDENLKPVSAMLLSLHEKPFTYTRFLKKANKAIVKGVNEIASIPRKLFFPNTIVAPDALNSLEKMMEPAMKQLIIFCDQFMDGLISIPATLYGECPFYELGIKLYHLLNGAGFPLCQPLMQENAALKIDGAYNINLALKMITEKVENPSDTMVYNDLHSDEKNKLFIITGANRGGKTTFTQAIGQIYWLAQLGLFVPANFATLRVIDGLFLHFPAEETQTDDYGRLGYECKMFSDLFGELTANSLLLMNESFSGTSHLESLTIATEVVSALKTMGVTTLFNTHLHELGASIDEINAIMQDTIKCKSLVAGSHNEHQSFKLHEGAPLGKSYAGEIASRYGVTFEQLTATDFITT